MQKMGNVQLIADLFKHGLLSESLVELILQKLLWGAAFNAVCIENECVGTCAPCVITALHRQDLQHDRGIFFTA